MYPAEPENFSIGPVTFHNRVAFRTLAEELLASLRTEEAGDPKPTLSEQVLGLYRTFSWVADVTIIGCDKETGEERALQAVGAAVDFMHLLFGHYHSRKMVVGGPSIERDLRAKFEIRDGQPSLSYSIAAMSAVGFPNGWASMLDDPETQRLINIAGRAIEAIADPSLKRPLASRFVDAASWHGDAVRETSAAASIIKSVTALERLVAVKKTDDTTRIVTERCAAIVYSPHGDERFEDLVKTMKSIYDLRSRLAHGTLSPFDAEVRERRYEVISASEKALINGLALFDQDGLFDKPLSRNELTNGLDRLVVWVRDVDLRKTAYLATAPV